MAFKRSRVRSSPSPPNKRNRTARYGFFCFIEYKRIEKTGSQGESEASGGRFRRSGACRQKIYLLSSDPLRLNQIKNLIIRSMRLGIY